MEGRRSEHERVPHSTPNWAGAITWGSFYTAYAVTVADTQQFEPDSLFAHSLGSWRSLHQI